METIAENFIKHTVNITCDNAQCISVDIYPVNFNSTKPMMIRQLFAQKANEMLDWCKQRIKNPPFYTSADIRQSNFKVSPIDINLFPAGFHLLSPESSDKATSIVKERYSNQSILIITEDHTRNKHYSENVYALSEIIRKADNNVHAIPMQTFKNSIANNSKAFQHYDLIILNNDMISEDPLLFTSIQQECIPSPFLGWSNRTKSQCFEIYDQIVREFCATFAFDPWFISAYHTHCIDVDLAHPDTIEELSNVVSTLLDRIKKKYSEYKIESEPFVFIKANRGSYGMGISSVKSLEEVLKMNKNQRKSLKMTKGRTYINELIIQEGVETHLFHNGHPAEVLMYSLIGQPLESMYRCNFERGSKENLNSQNMYFTNCSAYINSMIDIVYFLTIISSEREMFCVDTKKSLINQRESVSTTINSISHPTA